MSDLRVTNLKGRTPGSSPTLPDGVVVTGVATATNVSATNVSASSSITAASFYGDGSQLEGIDATSLKDSNSTIRVQATTSGAVVTGVLTATTFSGDFSGDGSGLTFAPKIIAYDPAALSTGISTTTNITFTFDQTIEFAGTGTIEVRETSNSGTIATSFAISGGTAPTGLSIVNNQLIINPTEPLNYNTVHYVVLPSAGIANTHGSYYAGSNEYNFQTQVLSFSAEGGDHTFDVNTGTGPTGWHRYHVFTSTGILTTTDSTSNATDLSLLMVAGGGAGGHYGGGGAGGVITHTGPTLGLSAGTFTITIGGGGGGGALQVGGTGDPDATPGNDTTLTPPASPTTYLLRAYGGGRGGSTTWQYGSGDPGGSGGGVPGKLSPTTVGQSIGGQGYPGGSVTAPPLASYVNTAGGGGGSGAVGGQGSFGPQQALEFIYAGDGGIGAAQPQFTDTLISSHVSSIPALTFAEIGPSGRYAGGGGASGRAGPPGGAGSMGSQGFGGAGGGGDGRYPATGVPNAGSDGFANTGGGGGGGSDLTARTNGIAYPSFSGGSGVVMMRYTVPAP